MQREDLPQSVRELIARVTALPLEDIERAGSFNELGIDSLDVLRIAAAFEQFFNVTITTAELTRISTVDDIVTELERKLATAEHTA